MKTEQAYNQHFTLWRARFGKPINAAVSVDTLRSDYDLEYIFPSCEFSTEVHMDYEAHKACVSNIIEHIGRLGGFRSGDLLVYGTGTIEWAALCVPSGSIGREFCRLEIKNSPRWLELVVLPN